MNEAETLISRDFKCHCREIMGVHMSMKEILCFWLKKKERIFITNGFAYSFSLRKRENLCTTSGTDRHETE